MTCSPIRPLLLALTMAILILPAFAEDGPTSKPASPEAKPAAPKAAEPAPKQAEAPQPATPKADNAKPAKKKTAKKKKARKAKKAKKKKKRGGPFGDPDQVIKRLKLTGEQATQVKAGLNEFLTTQRETYQKQRQALGAAYRTFFRKMKATLSPESYEELLAIRRGKKKKKGKKNKSAKGKKNKKGKKGKRRPRGPNRAVALRVLGATPEEAAVLTPLLDSVIQTKQLLKGEERRRLAQLRRKMAKETDEVALGKLLKEHRAAQADADATLKKHEQQLVEVLTPAQELKLIGLGVLR